MNKFNINQVTKFDKKLDMHDNIKLNAKCKILSILNNKYNTPYYGNHMYRVLCIKTNTQHMIYENQLIGIEKLEDLYNKKIKLENLLYKKHNENTLIKLNIIKQKIHDIETY